MNTTSRQRFLASTVAAGAVGTAFPHIARVQTLDKVSVGIVNTSSDAVFFVADKLGYFRDAGIEVTLIPFQSTPMTVAPLGVGQLDVAGGSPSGGGVTSAELVKLLVQNGFSYGDVV